MKTVPTIAADISPDDIVQYYDDCEIDYRWVWHLDGQHAMHYGYWDTNTKSLREALGNLNKVVMDNLDIKDGMKCLDAGCGVGGTAAYIACRTDAHIHGITLSQNQVQKARHKSETLQLSDRVAFSVRDYTKTGLETHSFDRIYAIESVCHANEKADFLREAARLLKPGGRLVVTDFFQVDKPLPPQDEESLQKWALTWAVPSFEKVGLFEQKAKEAGFIVEKSNNITTNIQKSARRLYLMFYPGYIAHLLLRLVRYRNAVQGRNVWSTYYQYKTLKKGMWQYQLFSLKKPS